MWDFYAHLEPPTDNQLVFLRVLGQVVMFTRHDILAALAIKGIPTNNLSFLDVVAQMPTDTPAFRKMCANLTNCGFNKRYLWSSLLK